MNRYDVQDADTHMTIQTSFAIPNDKPLTFEIVFDGGSLGNPGKGYGSFDITSNGEPVERQIEIQYGDNVTNNQAEYQTLIEALTWLKSHLGNSSRLASVEILGDSKLVLMQSQGKWKVNNEGLKPLNAQVKQLMTAFGKVTLTWHARKHSVAKLGH